jgi:hypothetical protein
MITIISYPNENLNESIAVPTSIDSTEMVQNIWINVSEAGDDEYIEVTYNEQTITLLITDECRYTPIDIAYQNKEGAIAFMPFFKAKIESLSVEKENFESDRGQASDGFHQFVDFNVQGKTKYSINSGFVKEEMNEIIKQMMLSERICEFVGGNYIPLVIKSSSVEYKTRQKDRLINYTIEFEYAFNEVNNV